jgi:hypothetical protein
MRSKQDYVLEVNEKGKSAPKKLGLAPIQRDGMEYEFTTVFDVGMDHSAMASKDRTGLFADLVEKIDIKHGKILAEWLAAAKPQPAKENKPKPAPTGLYCLICDEELLKGKQNYYCQNYEDESEGKHTLVPIDQYDKFLAEQKERSLLEQL